MVCSCKTEIYNKFFIFQAPTPEDNNLVTSSEDKIPKVTMLNASSQTITKVSVCEKRGGICDTVEIQHIKHLVLEYCDMSMWFWNVFMTLLSMMRKYFFSMLGIWKGLIDKKWNKKYR